MKRAARFLAFFLLAVFLFTACASSPPSITSLPGAPTSGVDAPTQGGELAMVTTEERLNSPFGQSVWGALSRFAGENGYTLSPYKTEADNTESIRSTLELAVKSGAKLVVTADEAVTAVASESHLRYGDVSFILLDGADSLKLFKNAMAIRFSPEQAGWLAGYLAALKQPAQLACLEEEGSERSRLYTLGYLLGAEAAAEDLGLQAGSLKVLLGSWNDETETEEKEAFLNAVFADTQNVLFATTKQWLEELHNTAIQQGGWLIGPGLQPNKGNRGVLAALYYGPGTLVYEALGSWQAGRFPGGQLRTGTAAEEAVRITYETESMAGADEVLLAQLPSRFFDDMLPSQLAADVKRDSDGNLPTPRQLSLPHLVLYPQDEPSNLSQSLPISSLPDTPGNTPDSSSPNESGSSA